MGVPKFFRWLVERYPLVLEDVDPRGCAPTSPFDNLYLDLNGVLHNAYREVVDSGGSDETGVLAVMRYIELLFSVASPRRLLFIAVDGVAPRAKMNQQRARRFRAAKDSRTKREAAAPGTYFDSNAITPGTEFMTRMTEHLKFFIQKKQAEEFAWAQVNVIFSGQVCFFKYYTL